MAKISRVGGFTDATARALLPAIANPGVLTDAEGEPAEKEKSWPGSSSETSPEKPPKSDEPEKDSRPKHVRETGSRSKRGRAGSSSAGSTATSGPATDD